MNNFAQNPLAKANNQIPNAQSGFINPIQALLMAQILSGIVNPAPDTNGASQVYNTVNGQEAHAECILNLDEHLKYADALVSAGIIDKNTGESIKKQMTANFKAVNKASAPQAGPNPLPSSNFNAIPASKSFDINQSAFLKTRECLLNYLKNLDIELDEDDLRNIEEVVLELEKTAILRHAKDSGDNGAQDALKLLNQSNEIAKGRLITGPLKGSKVKEPLRKIFSRDEIAKMSTAEFIKNEPAINYQLQNGLL